VQSTFSDKSEIQLQEFIQPDKYGQLCEALHSIDASDWITQGPANKRNYECSESTSSVVLNEARKFFQSEAFFLVLSNLTGLKLHRLASTPSSSENESSSDESMYFFFTFPSHLRESSNRQLLFSPQNRATELQNPKRGRPVISILAAGFRCEN
jgi:hypothetical protein